MVIDTSALLAILFDEAERDSFIAQISASPIRVVSAAAIVEASIVFHRRLRRPGTSEIDALVARLDQKIWPIDLDQLKWARYAVEAYGRGRHSARLNFGDYFSYALARVSGEPLLFKGDDFSKTDIASAL